MAFKYYLSFILFSISSIGQASGLWDYLYNTGPIKSIREVIAEQDINVSIPIFNYELLSTLKMNVVAERLVEDSYEENHFSRIDRWTIPISVDAGSIIKNKLGATSPLSFSINAQRKIIFSRQYKNKKAALFADDYSFADLPLNADAALQKMNVGDLASFPGSLNISVGASVGSTIPGVAALGADAGIGYVISGDFDILIYKIDLTHVRLKMISVNGENLGASANLKLSFNVFKLGALNNSLERVVETEFIKINDFLAKNAHYVVDYLFDLSSPEARAAFNDIINSNYSFKEFTLLKSDVQDTAIENQFIAVTEKAENLFKSERSLPANLRKVHRIFKGFDNNMSANNNFKIGFLFTSDQDGESTSEATISFVDKNDQQMNFYYPNTSRYERAYFGKWFFEFKDESQYNVFALIPIYNSDNHQLSYPELGVTFERRDKFFYKYEEMGVERLMINQIPSVLAKNIDFSAWTDDTTKNNTRIFFQVILKSSGFKYLIDQNIKNWTERLLQFLNEKRSLNINQFSEANIGPIDKFLNFLFFNQRYTTKDVNEIAEKLDTIFKSKDDKKQMAKAMINLTSNKLFSRCGIGFLISQFPQNNLSRYIYVKVEMQGEKEGEHLPVIQFQKGILTYEQLYRELNEAQSFIANRGYDLRLTKVDDDLSNIDLENLETTPVR